MFDVCLVPSSGQNWEQQWSYVLSHFSPRRLYTVGEVDPRVRPFRGLEVVNSAADLPETPLVLMSPRNAQYIKGRTPLGEFRHPDECVYMFGSDAAHLNADHLGGRTPEHLVYIPTDTPDTMYSFMAGAITLYDRMMRHG